MMEVTGAYWRLVRRDGIVGERNEGLGGETRQAGYADANPPYGERVVEKSWEGWIDLRVQPLVPSAPGQRVVRANRNVLRLLIVITDPG